MAGKLIKLSWSVAFPDPKVSGKRRILTLDVVVDDIEHHAYICVPVYTLTEFCNGRWSLRHGNDCHAVPGYERFMEKLFDASRDYLNASFTDSYVNVHYLVNLLIIVSSTLMKTETDARIEFVQTSDELQSLLDTKPVAAANRRLVHAIETMIVRDHPRDSKQVVKFAVMLYAISDMSERAEFLGTYYPVRVFANDGSFTLNTVVFNDMWCSKIENVGLQYGGPRPAAGGPLVPLDEWMKPVVDDIERHSKNTSPTAMEAYVTFEIAARLDEYFTKQMNSKLFVVNPRV